MILRWLKKRISAGSAEDFATEASRRHFGAGSDGLLVVEDSAAAFPYV
jgi:hypothetical protein